MKSPWNSTGTPNLKVRGMGDVERGAVLQAGVLINMLLIAKVLFPQSSTIFLLGYSRLSSMHCNPLFRSLLPHPYFSLLSGSFKSL